MMFLTELVIKYLVLGFRDTIYDAFIQFDTDSDYMDMVEALMSTIIAE